MQTKYSVIYTTSINIEVREDISADGVGSVVDMSITQDALQQIGVRCLSTVRRHLAREYGVSDRFRLSMTGSSCNVLTSCENDVDPLRETREDQHLWDCMSQDMQLQLLQAHSAKLNSQIRKD